MCKINVSNKLRYVLNIVNQKFNDKLTSTELKTSDLY